MAPVTLAVTRELQIPPYPFLFAEVVASNIGGSATLIGDPPNIMIGSAAGLHFNAFFLNVGPAAAAVLVAQVLMTHPVWDRATRATVENRLRVMTMNAGAAIVDEPLLVQSAAALALVVGALIFEDKLYLEPATIAMGGAAVLMLLDNWRHHRHEQADKVARTFTEIEWITIFFFLGLFIVVHAVEVSGLMQVLADKLIAMTGDNLASAGYTILWGSALISAIIDNIPLVATLIPVIKTAGYRPMVRRNTSNRCGGACRLAPASATRRWSGRRRTLPWLVSRSAMASPSASSNIPPMPCR